MIMPSDVDYKETKQIMLGKASMNPDFKPLAAYIDQTFDVKTINIVHDVNPANRPRIGICFEFQHEENIFWDKNRRGFDPSKEKLIIDRFRKMLESGNEKYSVDNMFAYYSSFEPVAKIEANENIPQGKIEALKNELNNGDLWEIRRFLGSVTFFLLTDEQVKLFEKSGRREIWTRKYFDILEPYNEFGYLKPDTFRIRIDSKENFDKNYESNWFYYSRNH